MKKAILVPSEMMQSEKPVDETLGNLDIEMMRIINTRNLPADIKLSKYYQTLQRYKTLQTKRNNPYEIGIDSYTDTQINLDSILKGIPESKIPQARLLTDFITNQNGIHIEDNGEIIINGTKINNSNIVDIIHDLIRDRKTHLPPKGVEDLVKVLKRANIPLEYIGNKNRLQLFQHIQQQQQPPPFQRGHNEWVE